MLICCWNFHIDTGLARTFVEIVSRGSFIRTAERLNVGQTTVSARIRLLEQQLGRSLFVRNKSGAILTPAGEQFLRFAPTFVQLWQRAGSEVTLWQPLLLDWVVWLRHVAGETGVKRKSFRQNLSATFGP